MKSQIQLPAAELRVALAGLNKVINKKMTLPVLQHVRVSRNDRGVVSLQATDLDGFVTYHATEFQPGPTLDVLVPGESLSKTVKSTKEPVTIGFDGKRVSLRSVVGNTPFDESLDTLAVAEWPKLPVLDQPTVPLNDGFKACLREALECAGTDTSRVVLMGAHLDVSKPGAHYVVGTNGSHLYSANSFTLGFKESLTVPTTRFIAWSDFMADGEWLAAVKPPKEDGKNIEAGYMLLRSNRWEFITKLIDQRYPVWRNVVPNPERSITTVELSEDAVATLLQVMPRLPGDEVWYSPVTFKVADRRLFVSGCGKNGTSQEVGIAGARLSGKPENQIVLNRDYVAKALRFGLNTIEIEDSLSVARMFRDGKQMLIMPVRQEGAPTTTASPQKPPTPPINGAAATPSAPPVNNPTETERKEVNGNTMTAPERGNLKAHTNGADENALKSLGDKLEGLKTSLRDIQTALTDALSLVRAAEKENKQKEKEIESIRATVRSLQRVQI